MKITCRVCALLLALTLLLASIGGVFAATGTLRANTGERGRVCARLSEQAEAYYTGMYSYENLSRLSGVYNKTDSYAVTRNNPLYDRLYTLMSGTQTHSVVYAGYSQNSLAGCWTKTDAECGSGSYLFFYTDVLSAQSGLTLNREHVWPKSRASFYQEGGGADLHHLRPSVDTVNRFKLNYAFGNVVDSGAGSVRSTEVNGKTVAWTGVKSGTTYFEVLDNVKGDVARILLYVYVRWKQPNLYSDVAAENLPPLDTDYSSNYNTGVKVVEDLDTLLQWCREDPVDEWEMGRNDQVENVQGNRNVFIDYPELAWRMFGMEIPQMQTPSGNALRAGFTVCAEPSNCGTVRVNGSTITAEPIDGYLTGDCTVSPTDAARITRTGRNTFTVTDLTADCVITVHFVRNDCPHPETESVRVAPTCTKAGAVRTVCKSCGAVISEKPIAALGHDYQETVVAPTCTAKGYTEYTCTRCGDSYKKKFTAMVDHKYENGKCTVCGAADPSYKPEEDKTPKYGDFSDLKTGRWYEAGVTFALKNGLMNGVGGGKFDPDGSVTRGMLVTILYRVEKTPSVEGMKNPFTDVKSGAWYTDAIVWAADQGIVNGTSATTFAPDAFITREQIATILYRYAKAEKTEKDLSAYPDAGTVSGYAVDAMRWAVAEGLINGKDGRLAPQENATRAQIATILERYLSK